MINLGDQIYKYRREKGLSQLELADILEVSRQAISKWETNVAVPELLNLVKMAEVFGISLDELILDKENAACPTVPTDDEKEEETDGDERSHTESDAAELQTYCVPPIKSKSIVKTIFGALFLLLGAGLSVLLLREGEFVWGAIILIPFVLSAIFCLKQLRHALLWCVETWFAFVMMYLSYTTGVYWKNVLYTMYYISEGDHISPWYLIISWASFFILVLLIFATIWVYRKHRPVLSLKKHIALAIAALTVFPIKGILIHIIGFAVYFISGSEDSMNFHYNISHISRLIEYPLDLIAIAVFTACLVPTFYWCIRSLKESKLNKT